MATRSPTTHHSYWGDFADAASLPAGDPRLQAGDTAYATAEAALYVYDGAAWAPVGSGGTVAIASERWVTTDGNDVTGDGSLSAPYATIAAAMASITTASPSNRWAIRIASGTFTEAAPIALKPNVYLIGEDRNATRITAPSVTLDGSFAASGDNRSGFANMTLTGACNFDFSAVSSIEGKIYANNVNFSSAVTFFGFNAINQTIIFNCIFFGAFTSSGVNHGLHVACVHSGFALNQHPSLPSILNAVGGESSNFVMTTTVNNFARRCSVFAKSFWMEPLTIDGPASYLDATASALPPAGANVINGGNLISLDQGAWRNLSNLQSPTSIGVTLLPDTDSNRYIGDFGRQWLFTFSYLVTSTGTDLYLLTTPSTFSANSPGLGIFLQPDSYGLALDANGGVIRGDTAAATGVGNSGSITFATGSVDTGTRGDFEIDANELNIELDGALNINTAPGAAGEVLTSQGAGLPPVWQASGAGGAGASYLTGATNEELTVGGGVEAVVGGFVFDPTQSPGRSFYFRGFETLVYTAGAAPVSRIRLYDRGAPLSPTAGTLVAELVNTTVQNNPYTQVSAAFLLDPTTPSLGTIVDALRMYEIRALFDDADSLLVRWACLEIY